ncbi:MAG: alpha-glucosidase family protein [Parvibaculum sp.]|jgi:alpha-glucosidase|uniref:alpha-glucosidase family protein n=1 Tax=Parvibaculum sp. TaxID=2024848 RepID=UPI002850E5E4|nr:alpha-glucosidase family protein [Parvibaculum sp.]MDR3500412.1 alpha-glucosidase family protein [Parvibaculum sp.]
MEKNKNAPWWQGAVVYQIYPRSFRDTNGDGVGDLKGIEEKLDYVASLGVDAIWLSPIYPTPNRDFGYDISDYVGIAPEMGTMADFDRLVKESHARGIKVILDQVLSHTSDQHPWFQESLLSRDNAKSDWYVWAEAKEDGTPPNNWLAAFGGAAWSWHPLRRQYYFHKFLKSQPKLNFHNPEVVDACMDVLRFWLDRGVDGFRLDVANSYVHDEKLTNNPPVPMAERTWANWAHAPRLQRHIYDANTPENEWAMKRVRKVMDEYKDRLAFGEFSEEPSMFGVYAGGMDKLHTGYTFDFLEDWTFKPHVFRKYFDELLMPLEHLWPCVTFSNHDIVRPVTRWGGGKGDDALAKLALTLLVALKGTVLMYQGEELGLPEVDLERKWIQDPVGDLYFPFGKGRDGCRTPMPWEGDAHEAGFTSGAPWLPIPDYHRVRAAAAQEGDAHSVLAHARAVIAARKAHPALARGDIKFVEAEGEQVLAFERAVEGERLLCVFNLSRETAGYTLPAGAGETVFSVGEVKQDGAALTLAGRSGVVFAL